MSTSSCSVVVRFSDLDPYGHVNHSVYLTYFELGRAEYLKERGQSLLDLSAEGIQLVVVELQISYKASVDSASDLRVDSKIVQQAASYVVWQQELYDGERLCATAEVKVAALGETGRPIRLPSFLITE